METEELYSDCVDPLTPTEMALLLQSVTERCVENDHISFSSPFCHQPASSSWLELENPKDGLLFDPRFLRNEIVRYYTIAASSIEPSFSVVKTTVAKMLRNIPLCEIKKIYPDFPKVTLKLPSNSVIWMYQQERRKNDSPEKKRLALNSVLDKWKGLSLEMQVESSRNMRKRQFEEQESFEEEVEEFWKRHRELNSSVAQKEWKHAYPFGSKKCKIRKKYNPDAISSEDWMKYNRSQLPSTLFSRGKKEKLEFLTELYDILLKVEVTKYFYSILEEVTRRKNLFARKYKRLDSHNRRIHVPIKLWARKHFKQLFSGLTWKQKTRKQITNHLLKEYSQLTREQKEHYEKKAARLNSRNVVQAHEETTKPRQIEDFSASESEEPDSEDLNSKGSDGYCGILALIKDKLEQALVADEQELESLRNIDSIDSYK